MADERMTIADMCEKCRRCHDYGLRDDEECLYYGEPNGCNHPDYGYAENQKTYEDLRREVAEKDAEIAKLREDKEYWMGMYDALLATYERSENETKRLRAALKPVIDCPRIPFADIVQGTSADAINAVREAKRIFNEGGDK